MKMLRSRIDTVRIFKLAYSIVLVIGMAGLEPVFAQTGHIEGKVLDNSTGETLIGANIVLSGTAIGTASDNNGEYHLRNLPEGRQVLSVSYLGYRSEDIEAVITAGETLELNIELEPDLVEGEEIVIYSQALAQAEAIRRQLNANTIVNVVSAARLRELPDANAAEAVGRLPGVSILRSAGEANKVAIRGLGPQYNSVTIDGDRVTGTDLAGREVDMSMISPDMLSGVEVYKVLRPDMDADAIGGSVNFSFSGAPRDNQYRISLSSGYHDQINGLGGYKGSASGSRRFFNGLLGVLGTVSSERVDRSSHVFDASYNVLRSARDGEPHAPIETSSVRLLDRQEVRERYGAGLNLDLEIPGGRFYMNNFLSRLNRDEVSVRRSYDVDANRQDWLFGDRNLHIDILTSSLGGEHAFIGGGLNVDWRISRNVSAQHRPYDNQVLFRETNALNRDIYTVGMPPDQIPGAQYNNLDNTSLESLDHTTHNARERDIATSLNIEIPIRLGRLVAGNIKLGGKHYNKDRYRESHGMAVRGYMYVPRYQTYAIITHDEFPLADAEDGRPSIRPFIDDDPYSILGDQYEMRLEFNRDLANSMWEKTGNLYFHNSGTRLNDFEATERVSAGYIMTELNLGERLMVLPGVRYELENGDYDAVRRDFVQTWVDDAGWEEYEDRLEDVSASREEGMWFPMFQARYRPMEWLDIRAAWTQSTSRPAFSQLTPRRVIDENSRTVSRGQPNLKLPKSINYDVFFTINSNRLGLVSLGGFYKEIDNLILNRQTVSLNPEELELPAGTRGFTVSEPINNPNLTTVRGLEMEWQSNLTWLPVPFNGLVVGANFTRIFSKSQYPGFRTERTSEGTIVIDTFRVAQMVHQPNYIGNASVGYDYRGFSARLSMLYQGATLTTVSATRPELDQFTEDYLRWDLALKQNVLNGLASVFANVQNLTNRRDLSIQFTEQYPQTMEYYGWVMNMGVRVHF